ncbi:DUF4293 domain-containing protein [Cytophagales bacterium LB-30]|uniref:DUF4293 domain-containing protein n=1 Tax=Shiella aurantiaca TaxID=3058365 RepID=A0ABT8F6A0_9BACT|nr:DUF4293 domain-containing protein [Shiella aurantiaca]MDN4165970.1 DUF4293 domain-containing protein [Shiella aurantiaca]
MIQRIQSVLLLLMSLCLLGSHALPLWVKQNPETTEKFVLKTYGVLHYGADGQFADYTAWPYAVSGVLFLVAAVLGLVSIFQYKNRLNQIKIGALNSLLMGGGLFMVVWRATAANEAFMPEIYGDFVLGMSLPITAMVFNIIANRFIRRDENMVRSADRIR